MALVQEGGFGIWEKKDLPHLSNFESVPNFDKERQYKYLYSKLGLNSFRYWTSSIQFVPYIASYLSDANEEKEN